MGQQGHTGFTGYAGKMGATGKPGPYGLPGGTGYTGMRGIDGEIGDDGVRGYPGLPGRAGEAGAGFLALETKMVQESDTVIAKESVLENAINTTSTMQVMAIVWAAIISLAVVASVIMIISNSFSHRKSAMTRKPKTSDAESAVHDNESSDDSGVDADDHVATNGSVHTNEDLTFAPYLHNIDIAEVHSIHEMKDHGFYKNDYDKAVSATLHL